MRNDADRIKEVVFKQFNKQFSKQSGHFCLLQFEQLPFNFSVTKPQIAKNILFALFRPKPAVVHKSSLWFIIKQKVRIFADPLPHKFNPCLRSSRLHRQQKRHEFHRFKGVKRLEFNRFESKCSFCSVVWCI